MKGKFKPLALLVILVINSFWAFTPPAQASKQPFIPKNKIVALVYDDSGSMWSDEKNKPIDNWKYANYALQSFVALMDPHDQLKVIFMSSPGVAKPIKLDETNRQQGINEIRSWEGKKSTPVDSLHTAINELNKAAENNANSDFWLVVLTDGIFNEMNNPDPNKTQQNKSDLFNRLKNLKEKMDKKGASFHATLIPIETFLNSQEQSLMGDFKQLWKENSNGMVLESKGEQDIIQRINEVAALMTNRDPNQQNQFNLNPVMEGNQLILQSPFPLRRMTIIEQSIGENVSNSMKEFYMNNKRIDQGIEGPYQINTPDDPAKIHEPINGTVTHLKNENGNSIESGTYKIVFASPLSQKQMNSIQVLAEPAIDFKTDFQKINDDGSLTSDPSVFFEGSKMRIQTTLIKSESTNEEINLRAINVKNMFNVEAQIGSLKIPLHYDKNLNTFIGEFPLTSKGEIPVKVTVNIKGIYQQEKETSLKSNPVRQMELAANTNAWTAQVDQLNAAKPFVITPMINGKEISAGELKKIYKNLSIETSSHIKIEKRLDGNKIVISPKALTPLFRTSVGDINLHITLPGLYPKEKAEGTFTLTIKDTSFLKKYGEFILFIILFLMLLAYIVGIIIKPRFDQNRISIEYKQRRKGSFKDVRPRTMNFQGSWVKRWLVPYWAEKRTILDLTFKAHRQKDRVWLVKECQQPDLIVNHQKLLDHSKKANILIMNNDEIQIDRGNYETIYMFKSH